MMVIATKAALVVLAGIYAMRASDVIFARAAFTPLWFVALFAFGMSLVLFYRPPTVQGWWQYSVIGLCLVGVAANALLFFAPDTDHSNPTDLAFSAVSVLGWSIVGVSSFLLVFAAPPEGT
jgi:peptidoglycan/LPS O-acetylase OafA/YrhL